MSITTQDTAKVYVGIETLSYGENNFTGAIALQFGSAYFPERGWNDFPIIILRWWLKELLRLWHGELKNRQSVECLFMDGDFYFDVSACDGHWLIQCIEGIPDGEIVAEAEVDRVAFMRNVIDCATQTLERARLLKRQSQRGIHLQQSNATNVRQLNEELQPIREQQSDGTDALATMIRRGRREILSQAA